MWDILGILSKLEENRNNPKAIMRDVLASIINFKNLNQRLRNKRFTIIKMNN